MIFGRGDVLSVGVHSSMIELNLHSTRCSKDISAGCGMERSPQILLTWSQV